jgi:hypothetical protein
VLEKNHALTHYHCMPNRTHAAFLLLLAFAFLGPTRLPAAPAHEHPYLLPSAEKRRLLERLGSNEAVRRQFETIKTRARQGKFADAALVFALEGNEKSADIVRKHLLNHVRERTRSLDADIAAGGHRENNMELYWDTSDIRACDLV